MGVTWTQNVTDAATGAYLSSYAHDSGPYMTGYGTGTECDDSCTDTISAQKYLNTTLALASADQVVWQYDCYRGKGYLYWVER